MRQSFAHFASCFAVLLVPAVQVSFFTPAAVKTQTQSYNKHLHPFLSFGTKQVKWVVPWPSGKVVSLRAF